MRKIGYVIVCCVLASMGIGSTAHAQEVASTGYNPNSVHPIHESSIMYKKTLWRRMDLKEKQNRPFFAFNNEITKIIIEAVKAGVLRPYENDSLKTRMSKEQFIENLKLPEAGGGLTDEEKALGFGEEEAGGWGDSGGWGDAGGWGDDNNAAATGAGASETAGATEVSNEFLPNEISVLEIREDMVFDKKRSLMIYDIQSISLIIPAEKFETGLFRPVATFRYKDLVELFRSMPEEAIWFNPQNSAQHRNLADAFALRLFNGRITKISNPQNLEIMDIYSASQKEGLIKSLQVEQELIEFEHNLWEF